MLSNEEFMRQRAAKLNNDKIKEEQKQENDYTSKKSVYNKRLDKKTQAKYIEQFDNYKVVMYLSIPFCIIISLAATFCLLLMGLIKAVWLIWVIAIIFFIILYAGIITFFMRRGVNVKDDKDEYERLKAQIRKEVEAELRAEQQKFVKY